MNRHRRSWRVAGAALALGGLTTGAVLAGTGPAFAEQPKPGAPTPAPVQPGPATIVPPVALPIVSTTLCSYTVVRTGAPVHSQPTGTSVVLRTKNAGDTVTSPVACHRYSRGADGQNYVQVNLYLGGTAWMRAADLANAR